MQEVSDPVVVLEERLRGLEPKLKPEAPLWDQLVTGVNGVPRTGPARCRDGGIADQSPRRGCPWTPPGCCRPWRNIRCASPAAPEAAFTGRKQINNVPSVLSGDSEASPSPTESPMTARRVWTLSTRRSHWATSSRLTSQQRCSDLLQMKMRRPVKTFGPKLYSHF